VKAVTAIYNILSNNAALTAVVGDRINPLRIPEKSELPALAYQVVSNRGNMSKSGPSLSDFARLQVMIVAKTYASAIEVGELVRSAMEVETPSIFNGVKVQVIEYDGEVHLAEDNAGFAGLSTIGMDFIINYNSREVVISDFILLESGDFILLETGDKIII
jgi:hypothetical protein